MTTKGIVAKEKHNIPKYTNNTNIKSNTTIIPLQFQHTPLTIIS